MEGFNWTLAGFEVLPFILALVKLAQSLGVDDYWADWLRAGLLGGVALLIMNQGSIQQEFPLFNTIVAQVLTVLGIVLMSKGFWPEGRTLWMRLKGTDMKALSVQRVRYF